MRHDRKMEGEHRMKSSFQRIFMLAAWAVALPFAQQAGGTEVMPSLPPITGGVVIVPVTITKSNPTCEDVLAICQIQNLGFELEVRDVNDDDDRDGHYYEHKECKKYP
jgi:hypothetical protein